MGKLKKLLLSLIILLSSFTPTLAHSYVDYVEELGSCAMCGCTPVVGKQGVTWRAYYWEPDSSAPDHGHYLDRVETGSYTLSCGTCTHDMICAE